MTEKFYRVVITYHVGRVESFDALNPFEVSGKVFLALSEGAEGFHVRRKVQSPPPEEEEPSLRNHIFKDAY